MSTYIFVCTYCPYIYTQTYTSTYIHLHSVLEKGREGADEREREREEGREAEEKSRDVVGLRVYLFTNETMLEHARTI